MQTTRTALSTVAGIVLAFALTACGSAEAPATPARTSTTTATTAPGPTTSAAASATASGTAGLDRAAAALAKADAYTTEGYDRGQDAAPGATSADVCAKALDADRGTGTIAAARQWSKPTFTALNVVRAFTAASASDVVRQIRTAAGSCTTYTIATETSTLGAPVAATDHYGIDATFTYCEQVAGQARCTAYFGTGQKLAMLRVRATGTQSTSDVHTELERLADAVVAAVQA
jgi:hypothetical protein